MNKKCSNCDSTVLNYANSHFKLCAKCNKERLSGKKVDKKSSFIKPSKKSLEKVKALKEAKEAYTKSVDYVCEGCGKHGVPLDRSHIIPISLAPRLKYSTENLNLLCRDCHNIWEHGKIVEKKKLFCFESNLKKMDLQDSSYFRRFVSRLEDEH